MPARPIFLETFGRYLVGLRTALGWNQLQASEIAERSGLKELTYQRLRWIEEGKNKSPEPGLLRDIAALYGISYESLIVEYMADRYGVGRDSSDSESAQTLLGSRPSDISQVQMSHVREIETCLAAAHGEIAAYESALERVEELGRELVDLAAGRRDSPNAASSERRRRQRL